MDNSYPFVSVVMPVRNEKLFIEQAINSILQNDYPPDHLEILVADGMSDDGTSEILQNLHQKDARIIPLENPDKIVPAAMNLAIQKARGTIIVRVDAHAEYARDYIKSAVEVLQRTNAACTGGYMETLPGNDTPVAHAIAMATSSRFGVGGSTFRTGGETEQEVDAVPFGCFKKSIFDKVGLYNTALVRNQDIEMSSRIRATGEKILISPNIKLKYFNRSTYAALRKQSYSNGKWNAFTLFLVGGGLCLRHFIPLGFVIGLIGLLLIAVCGSIFFGGWALLPLMLYLAFYFLCGGTEAVRTAAGKGLPQALRVTFCYFQMHLWYGAGTLAGLIAWPFIASSLKERSYGTEGAGR